MRKLFFSFLLFWGFSSIGYAQISASGLKAFLFGSGKEVDARQKLEDKELEDKLCDKPCPQFAFTDTEGKLWTKQNIEGKVTLINIWHVYCAACITEIPHLNELIKAYPQANFLSMTFNTPAQIKKTVTENSFLFHHLTNAISFISKTGITATPTNLLIDKTGTIRYIIRGGGEKQYKLLNEKLKELSK